MTIGLIIGALLFLVAARLAEAHAFMILAVVLIFAAGANMVFG
jgi:hypothetical protein